MMPADNKIFQKRTKIVKKETNKQYTETEI